jgi:D-tyrosyl-tRNA(Tyr) deacylase
LILGQIGLAGFFLRRFPFPSFPIFPTSDFPISAFRLPPFAFRLPPSAFRLSPSIPPSRVSCFHPMRAVVQRVASARVTVGAEVTGEIGPGLLVLLGVGPTDTATDAQWLADKICALRIFADAEDRMNLSVVDRAGGVLVVSQFTLFASTKKGTRPSFNDAASKAKAISESGSTRFLTRKGRSLSTRNT